MKKTINFHLDAMELYEKLKKDGYNVDDAIELAAILIAIAINKDIPSERYGFAKLTSIQIVDRYAELFHANKDLIDGKTILGFTTIQC